MTVALLLGTITAASITLCGFGIVYLAAAAEGVTKRVESLENRIDNLEERWESFVLHLGTGVKSTTRFTAQNALNDRCLQVPADCVLDLACWQP